MNLLNYKNYGRLWRVYGRSLFKYTTAAKLSNAVQTEWAYRRRHADVRSAPYILLLEPLYYCNLECPLCDRQIFPDVRKGLEAGKLSLPRYETLLDEIGQYLFQCQIFGQGEPLLDWPLTRSIIKLTHSRRIFTLMSTNCTLATPDVAEETVTSGLDHLVCAIDGVSQKSYSQYRAGGHIEDALAGLSNFVAAREKMRSKIEIEWQFLVHKGNEHEIESARQLARKMGVFLRFSPLRGMEFDHALQQAWLTPRVGKQTGDTPLGESVYQWPCYFLWRALTLNSNHKLARCLIYQNVAEYADLNQVSAMQAYRSPTMVRARQLFSRKMVAEGDFPSPCANCSFYAREHGGQNLDKHAALGRERPAHEAFVPAAMLKISPRRTGLSKL